MADEMYSVISSSPEGASSALSRMCAALGLLPRGVTQVPGRSKWMGRAAPPKLADPQPATAQQ